MLFNKKSNLVLQFIILIIIAAIMIFVVTAFGVKIFEAIFPSGDKATIKSFETLYSTIDLKSKDMKTYDSSRMTVYVGDDYQIYTFRKGQAIPCPGSNPVQVPSQCKDKTKNCICLYNNAPDKDDKNKNVERCHSFENDFIIISSNLDSIMCAGTDRKFYGLIIGAQYDGKNHDIYIWENTEKNRAEDEKFSKETCPQTSDALCVGKKSGTILIGKDWSKQVVEECKKKDPAIAASGTCEYDKDLGKCTLKCNPIVDCKTITKCEDYNIIDSGLVSNARLYIIAGGLSEDYCIHDYCGVRNSQCKMTPLTHYVCTKEDKTLCTLNADCNPIMLGNPMNNYIASYDTTKCTDLNKNNLLKVNDVYIQKGIGNYDEQKCIYRINDVPVETLCKQVLIRTGSNVYLMYYGTNTEVCKNHVTNCYDPIYDCESPNYNYEASNPKISSDSIDDTGRSSKPCREINDPSTEGKDYQCLINKDIKFLMDIKNTGAYDINARIRIALPSINTITGIETIISKGATKTISLTTKFTEVTTYDHEIILDAECTESICKNDPNLQFRRLDSLPNRISLKIVNAFS